MKLIVDTHVFLWASSEPTKIGEAATLALTDPGNDVYVSAIIAWEIAIKQSIGKLTLPATADEWLAAEIRSLRFTELDVTPGDAVRVCKLPFHHRDPFDRLLIAQALNLACTVVTHDRIFTSYGVPVLLA